MLVKSLLRGFFSTIKVPIQSLKRLRQQTSAPIGDCRKALEESQCDHNRAIQWLKQKRLLSADKRATKQTKEGVVASFVTPCRRKAVLLEVNCETDFVAKNDLFIKFVDNLGNKFLTNEDGINVDVPDIQQAKKQFSTILQSTEPSYLFPEDTSVKNMNEQFKLTTSRLQENIRIRRVITFHTDNCRYGTYVHRPYTQNVGLQACVVEIHTDPEVQDEEAEELINQFADDMATQILGSPPKYLAFQQITQDVILAQTQKVKEEVASVLAKAPEHTHQKIISGKLHSNFYSRVLLGCMPYVLSNEGAQVSQIWSNVQKQAGTNISILRYVTWQCK